METTTQYWLDFVTQVESDIGQIGAGYSASYVKQIFLLTSALREESARLLGLPDSQREPSFLRINKIGTELKSMACFVEA